MSQMLEFLNPVGIWFFQRSTKRSEKTIKQYYENVDRSRLSKELVEVLGRLVDNHEHARDIFKQKAVTDKDSVLHWDEDSFKKWVTADQPLPVISTFIPTLWRIFVYFAGFPFTEHIYNDSEGSTPQQPRIDEDGFVQAYRLLALGGVEVLGNFRNGWTLRGSVEKSWPQKSPRLASLMFDSLKIPSTELDERSQGLVNANLKDRAEKQLMDAIALTQPVPYFTGLSWGKELRKVAGRMRSDNVTPSYNEPSSLAVSRNDLQTFIQLILLLRIGNDPWTRRLIQYRRFQVCKYIEKLDFVSNQEEIPFLDVSQML
jgi:hypothetical protein